MKRLYKELQLELIPTFSTLDARLISQLERVATLKQLEAGEFLFRQGETAHAIYAIQSGGMRLVEHTTSGKNVVIKLYGAGDVFGLLGITGNRPYPASVEAIQQTEVIRIESENVQDIIKEYPQLGLRIIELLIDHVHHAHERIRNLASDDAKQRLARSLLFMHEKFGHIQCTQQELAEFIGVAIETVNRILNQWEQQGFLECGRGRIEIKQVTELQSLLDTPTKMRVR